jgi:TolB-like protein
MFLSALACASAQTQETLSGTGPAAADDPGSPEAQATTPSPEGQQDDRPGVAVWPFANGGSFGSDPWDYTSLEVGLQQMLITELAQNSELRLINRSRIREIIEELELGQTEYVAPGTTAQVGQLVGAKYMVVGSFVDANGTMRLDARVDNVETSEILNETAGKVQDDRENLLSMVVELGVKIVESVDLPPLPSEVVDERKSLGLTAETARTYFMALRRDDAGDLDEARQLYRRVVSEAPKYTPARVRLEQLGGQVP